MKFPSYHRLPLCCNKITQYSMQYHNGKILKWVKLWTNIEPHSSLGDLLVSFDGVVGKNNRNMSWLKSWSTRCFFNFLTVNVNRHRTVPQYFITMTLYGCQGLILNYRSFSCVLNTLFRLVIKQSEKLYIACLLWGDDWVKWVPFPDSNESKPNVAATAGRHYQRCANFGPNYIAVWVSMS